MHGMAYFILGALTDDPARLSRMTSFVCDLAWVADMAVQDLQCRRHGSVLHSRRCRGKPPSVFPTDFRFRSLPSTFYPGLLSLPLCLSLRS